MSEAAISILYAVFVVVRSRYLRLRLQTVRDLRTAIHSLIWLVEEVRRRIADRSYRQARRPMQAFFEGDGQRGPYNEPGVTQATVLYDRSDYSTKNTDMELIKTLGREMCALFCVPCSLRVLLAVTDCSVRRADNYPERLHVAVIYPARTSAPTKTAKASTISPPKHFMSCFLSTISRNCSVPPSGSTFSRVFLSRNHCATDQLRGQKHQKKKQK